MLKICWDGMIQTWAEAFSIYEAKALILINLEAEALVMKQ